MNMYYLSAGCLMFLVGLVHSMLGEVLIFRHLREKRIIPTLGGSALKERQVRILWANWHISTLFGWALAAIIIWCAQPNTAFEVKEFVAKAGFIASLLASLLVLLATKGKHPGWLGLLAVALLLFLG